MPAAPRPRAKIPPFHTSRSLNHEPSDHPAKPARRRKSRHRLFRRPRHLRRPLVDETKRRTPLRLHRQPRPAGRKRLRRHPGKSAPLRCGAGASRRLPHAAGARRHPCHPVRRLSRLNRRPDLLQHHPAWPRRHRHHAGRGDAGRRREHLGRRQHLQGQRHRALLPLRPHDQPASENLQTLAGPALYRRTGRPRGNVTISERQRLRLQNERGKSLLHRLQPVRRHPRSQRPRIPEQQHPHRRPHHGRGLLAGRRRHRSGRSAGALCRRRAGRAERPRIRRPGRADAGSKPHRRAARPRHERPNREPHHRSEKPRHLRSPRHGAPAYRLRTPHHRHSQRRHHRTIPHQRHPPRSPALPGALV